MPNVSLQPTVLLWDTPKLPVLTAKASVAPLVRLMLVVLITVSKAALNIPVPMKVMPEASDSLVTISIHLANAKAAINGMVQVVKKNLVRLLINIHVQE